MEQGYLVAYVRQNIACFTSAESDILQEAIAAALRNLCFRPLQALRPKMRSFRSSAWDFWI